MKEGRRERRKKKRILYLVCELLYVMWRTEKILLLCTKKRGLRNTFTFKHLLLASCLD